MGAPGYIGVTTGVQLGNIPHSGQLPSVASLTPAERNTQQRQGELLAKLEVSLVSVAEGVGSHSSKVVSLGLGMPAIPKNWWINHAEYNCGFHGDATFQGEKQALVICP